MTDSSAAHTAPVSGDSDRATILAGLLGLAEQTVALTDRLLACAPLIESRTGTTSSEDSTETVEPARPGIYRDRDGDIWHKTSAGWRLCLQHGVDVDSTSVWEWLDGHVRDYAPFIRLAHA
ncbi:hypothetical protein [Nocardia bovistercoris]|uniref:Uncharacterized protein n=1 Tax=Nocardia bovistercoris TaxID=2785916 RepID=A0A931I9Q1_9NOCA|nr:hypothetical protein [Nocardia bovistercoris]MBH0776951.1 hypothetical protein [Nocardia bovistercoris]